MWLGGYYIAFTGKQHKKNHCMVHETTAKELTQKARNTKMNEQIPERV